jgi:hypothetical protein
MSERVEANGAGQGYHPQGASGHCSADHVHTEWLSPRWLSA